MGRDVAEAGDERPGDLGVARLELIGEFVGGSVGERLQAPEDGVAGALVLQGLRDSARSPALNQGDALLDIDERPPSRLLTQSGTASARILRAAGVVGSSTSTTWTGRS